MAVGTPTECDIERRRGDTKTLVIRLTSDGSPIDVNGYTALLTINTIKAPDIGVSPVLGTQVFQAVGAPLNSPTTDGKIAFAMAQFAGSPAVPVGNYFYDVQITDGAGEIFTPLIGKFKVIQDITKN